MLCQHEELTSSSLVVPLFYLQTWSLQAVSASREKCQVWSLFLPFHCLHTRIQIQTVLSFLSTSWFWHKKDVATDSCLWVLLLLIDLSLPQICMLGHSEEKMLPPVNLIAYCPWHLRSVVCAGNAVFPLHTVVLKVGEITVSPRYPSHCLLSERVTNYKS